MALDALAALAAEGLETGRKRDGIVFNVSDLVDCPAQAVAAGLGLPGETLADAYAAYVTALGRVFHAALQARLGLVHGVTAEVPTEETLTVEGRRVTIKGRADIVDRDAVVEVKVSAGLGKARRDGPRLAAWLTQVLYYASVLGKGRAVLLVFDRCRPQVAVVEVEPGRLPDAAGKARALVRARAEAAARALIRGRPWDAAVPGPWCRYCRYRGLCSPPLGAAATASAVYGLSPGDGLRVAVKSLDTL